MYFLLLDTNLCRYPGFNLCKMQYSFPWEHQLVFFFCFILLSRYFMLVCLLNSLALILFISLKSPRGSVALIIPHTPPGVLSSSTVLVLAFPRLHFVHLLSRWVSLQNTVIYLTQGYCFLWFSIITVEA